MRLVAWFSIALARFVGCLLGGYSGRMASGQTR